MSVALCRLKAQLFTLTPHWVEIVRFKIETALETGLRAILNRKRGCQYCVELNLMS